MRYPVVLLDVGGTLVGPKESFGAVYSETLADLGFPVASERIERSVQETWQRIDASIPSGQDRYRQYRGGEAEFWLRFAGEVLKGAFDETVPEGLAERALPRIRGAFLKPSAWYVFPEVRPTLDRLRALGVRMGVVSNWDSNLPRVLEMLELAPYFETVVVSHVEGIEKPAPQLFLKAVERMGVSPADALYVGDVPELDLVGAEAAGIDAVLVDREGRIDDATHSPIADLSPLPELATGDSSSSAR